jgi:hypothetical protein
MKKPKPNPRPRKKAQAPPANPAEEKRLRQVRQLNAVRRLKANPDYQEIIVPRLEVGEQSAISAFLDPDISDADLRRAQARFIAVRHLANLLDDLEVSLEAAVAAHPAHPNDPPPAESKPTAEEQLLRAPAGGWFTTPTVRTQESTAETS